MKKHLTVLALLFAAGIVFTSFRGTGSPQTTFPEIQYPEGYRDWTHIKTYVVGPNNPVFKFIGGFNHVYANDKAMQGYQTGVFPDGSVIVSDVIEAKVDSINTREGKRHHLDVMVRDSKKYADAGGWGFEQFSEDSKTHRLLTPVVRAICTNCHLKEKDFVFSEYRK